MGMRFHQAGERQGPARSHRPGVGWSVGVNAAIRPSRKARSASTGSPLARVGQPSGSAQAGSRARLIPASGAEEEERHRQSPHRSKTRTGDFAREQQSVIWSLSAFSSAVSTLSRCSGIPSRTPVIHDPHIPCSQESITSTPACCNT